MVNIQADEIHMKVHNYEWSPIGRELIHIISSILKKYEWSAIMQMIRLQRKYHVQDKYDWMFSEYFPAHIEILSLSGTPLWFDYSLQLSLIKCGWWWWCWSWRWEYDCDIELSKAPVVWNSLWWPNSLQSITIAQQNTLSPLLGTLSKPMLTTLT